MLGCSWIRGQESRETPVSLLWERPSGEVPLEQSKLETCIKVYM